jgi:hypothetical protein
MTDNTNQRPGVPPTVRAAEARQGLRGRHILIVLLVSTGLAAAGMFAAWGWKAPDLARPGSQQRDLSRRAAQAFHAPEPAPIIPQPGQDHTAPDPR